VIDNGQVVIDTALIKNGTITNAKIANLAVDSAKLASAAVTEAKIGNAAVTNAKIANAAITNAKIDNAAITEAKIYNAAVTSAKIANAAITYAKIGDAEVDTLKIAGEAVTVPTTVEMVLDNNWDYSGHPPEYSTEYPTLYSDSQTMTFSSSGARTVVWVSSYGVDGYSVMVDKGQYKTYDTTYYITIYEGSTVINTQRLKAIGMQAYSAIIYPSAGVHTYTVELASAQELDVDVILTFLEVKR
jgi:hypothetical protein